MRCEIAFAWDMSVSFRPVSEFLTINFGDVNYKKTISYLVKVICVDF